MSLAFETPASFPQELIDKIIDELAITTRLGILEEESRDDLIACSLVSHSFRPRTIRHLFRRFTPANVYPLSELDGWEQLAEILSKNPHIVRSVTDIVLQSLGAPDSTLQAQAVHVMSLLVHVKRIEIWGTALDHWNPIVSRILTDKPITQVLLHTVPFFSFNNFASCATTCFRNTENLELQRIILDYEMPTLALESEFYSDVDVIILRLPSLKTLSCTVSEMSTFFDGVADGTIEVKHLQSLKLSHVSMRVACFAPLLQKSPLKTLEMADVDFQDSPSKGPAPLSLLHLETIHINYTDFEWLCASILLGMPQLRAVTVRFSRPCQSTKSFKLFDELATTYLPGLETFRLEDYSAKSKGHIIRACSGLVPRGILQWGAEREKIHKAKGGRR